MTLYEAEKGNSYCIEGLYVEPAITRRLQALGLNDGTIVNVLNRKKRGALIIRVRGTRLALGKHISSSIEVSPREEDSGENTGRENRNQEAGVTGNRKEENVSLEPDSLETDIQRNTSLREEIGRASCRERV